jgi:hypothetical protein
MHMNRIFHSRNDKPVKVGDVVLTKAGTPLVVTGYGYGGRSGAYVRVQVEYPASEVGCYVSSREVKDDHAL